MTEPIGQTLGSYALESLIGSGPNGRVYRARQIRLNRAAAVKLLDARFVATPDFSRRFTSTLQRVAAQRHANIVDIEDFNEQGGQAYIAIEQYDEGSLRTFMQRRQRERDPWQLSEVLDIVRQAVDGVQAAHEQGFIHGHIKPENILLQRRGANPQDQFRARLADLGLVEIANGAAIATATYLTPEQARGLAPTPQSDIYALGVLLYEVSTGFVPFAVRTAEEAVDKHLRAQPVPPRMVRKQLPAELETIILTCLAKRPEQRFASVADLSRALGDVIRSTSPASTVLLADLPTQSIPQQPGVTQRLPIVPAVAAVVPVPIDPSQQPTVRTAIDPDQQPTVRATNGPKLQLIDANGAVLHSVDLTGNGLTIGRLPANDMALEDEQVSRYQARVDWNGQQATLTDLGSANGTLLNGARIAANAATPWGWNQRVQIGPFALQLAPPLGVQPRATAQPALDPMLAGLLSATPSAPPAGATQAFGGARLGILLEQEQAVLTPGQRATLGLTLTNNSPTADTFTVSVEGAPGLWVGVPQQAVQLPAGGRAPLSLQISVPRESDSLAGDYPVVIRARSGTNPSESATARGRWTVLPFSACSLSISPRRASGRSTALYQVTVRNDGNAAETFLLQADDDAQALRYSFSEESVLLDPGQAATIGLEVSAPQRMLGTGDPLPFQVRAQAGNERPQSATAQFVQTAAIPTAIPIVVFVLIGLGLLFYLLNGNRQPAIVGLGTATPASETTALPTALPTLTPTAEPGAPVISQFAIDPASVQPGQQVTISWNVTGADSVDINVLGNVAAQGQQTRVVNETTDIVLTARGGGKETRQVRQVVIATPLPATATPLPSETTIPASATPVPATATPAPPSATPEPPSATPLPATATPAPNPTVAPPAPPIDLIDAAKAATWSNPANDNVGFGKPAQDAENGGWAESQRVAQLENGRPYFGPLYTIPLSDTGGFVAGAYPVTTIGQGQKFLAEVGFPNNTKDTTIKIQVLFNNQVIFEIEKQADGIVLPISADLAPFVGTGGTLTLRAENVTNPKNVGMYWNKPRVDTR